MRLVEVSVYPTDMEMALWQASAETVKLQLSLYAGKSAEELEKDVGFAQIVNSVVERMPRHSDIFRNAVIKSNEEFVDARQGLLSELLKIVERVIQDDNFTIKNTEISPQVLLEMITLFFGWKKENIEMAMFLDNLLKRKIITKEEVSGYMEQIDWVLKEFISLSQQNLNEFGENPDKFSIIQLEYLVSVGSMISDVTALTIFLEKNSIKVPKQWVERIPELFEKISTTYDYSILFDVATHLDAFPLRKVFQSRSFALQALTRSFITLSDFVLKDQSLKNRVWHVLQKSDRFVESLHAMQFDLLKFSKDAPKVLNNAISQVTKETIDRLDKCGYLDDLGSPPDQLIRSQIDSILEMLPHLSPQFAHLALRHFSFITENAIASILSAEKLPIELARLEKFDFSTLNVSTRSENEWPPLDFLASDEIEKSIDAERRAKEAAELEKKAENKNWFSMALDPELSKPKEVIDQKALLRKKAEEYKARVMAQLKAIRQPQKINDYENSDEEVLVPMSSSKMVSALNSLKISEADKIAIRPTYDKYRYETPNDDGMYDDEYDDELDTREFNVERLNEELESSSDDEDEAETPPQNGQQPSAKPATRGNRGRGGARGGARGASEGNQRTSDYTGGRERQMKERHKSDFKQRGADKKRRGGMI